MSDDEKNEQTALPSRKNWRDLAAEASQESDPNKLTDLVKQICDELDENAAPRKPVQSIDGFKEPAEENSVEENKER